MYQEAEERHLIIQLIICTLHQSLFFLWHKSPNWAQAASLLRSQQLDKHTQKHSRTPMNE